MMINTQHMFPYVLALFLLGSRDQIKSVFLFFPTPSFPFPFFPVSIHHLSHLPFSLPQPHTFYSNVQSFLPLPSLHSPCTAHWVCSSPPTDTEGKPPCQHGWWSANGWSRTPCGLDAGQGEKIRKDLYIGMYKRTRFVIKDIKLEEKEDKGMHITLYLVQLEFFLSLLHHGLGEAFV